MRPKDKTNQEKLRIKSFNWFQFTEKQAPRLLTLSSVSFQFSESTGKFL